MEEENLIAIREYDSVNEAEWDKSLLEGAGIYATIRNEIMAAVYPIGFAPAQLVIRNEDRTKAEEILDAYTSE